MRPKCDGLLEHGEQPCRIVLLIFLPFLLSTPGFRLGPLATWSCLPHSPQNGRARNEAGSFYRLSLWGNSNQNKSELSWGCSKCCAAQLIPSNPHQIKEMESHSESSYFHWHTAHVHTHLALRTYFFLLSRVFKVIIRRLNVFPSKFFFTIYNDDWKECNLITSLKNPQLSIFREEN